GLVMVRGGASTGGGGGGINGLKNRSGKCEGRGGGGQRGKEPEWAMGRTGRGGTRR
ncbi:unnamed protein product, partial [Sphagnum balticum]